MTIISDAFKSNELFESLSNIASDDKKQIEDYTQIELVNEAKYVLSTFHEGGHSNNDWLTGEYDIDGTGKKGAKKEVKALNNFIKKYSCE